jgi:hypothetical protein
VVRPNLFLKRDAFFAATLPSRSALLRGGRRGWCAVGKLRISPDVPDPGKLIGARSEGSSQTARVPSPSPSLFPPTIFCATGFAFALSWLYSLGSSSCYSSPSDRITAPYPVGNSLWFTRPFVPFGKAVWVHTVAYGVVLLGQRYRTRYEALGVLSLVLQNYWGTRFD